MAGWRNETGRPAVPMGSSKQRARRRKVCLSWRNAQFLVFLSVPNTLTQSGAGNVIYGP